MRYFIKTFGCQMNESDSQRIASFLERQHYQNTDKIENADLIVVNACSVRQTAIDRIWGLLNKIKKIRIKNKKIKVIITGCVLSSDKNKFEKFLAPYRTEGSGLGFDAVLNIKDFFTYHLLYDRKKDGMNYLELKAKHSNPKSAFVPIMTGCNNFCSYCVVPYTRGREISRSVKEIINEVKRLIKKDCQEIILLGQNVNSYQYGFAKLLQKINNLPGDFKIKFLTSHPKDMSDELIDAIAECTKISKEIHLPIQSGGNKILKLMNRGYTVKKYLNLIEKIRKEIPEAKISTDVIVGFPGETKKQFENTVKVFKEIKFDKAYINKYSVRPGTIASRFKDNILLTEKKRRWKILEEMVNLPTPKASAGKSKLIVILGPTASGKSSLAIKLAKKMNGEIISADSRQIYKGMDIGTGKITQKEMRGIPHYLLDIANPKKQFSVAEYRKLALGAIDKIYKKSKIPILCGGTGFYIQAITDGIVIPEIKPDWKLRKKLEKKSAEELFKQLKKLDPQRAKNIDAKNKRRLIRAIEIILKTGKPIPQIKTNPQYNVLYLGVKKSLPELKQKINQRVDKMIKVGLMKEAQYLIQRYGQTTVLKNTIGYKEWLPVKMRKAHLAGTAGQIKLHTLQYAKRQMTWFSAQGRSALGGKKYPGNKIHWISNFVEAEKLVKEFLP